MPAPDYDHSPIGPLRRAERDLHRHMLHPEPQSRNWRARLSDFALAVQKETLHLLLFVEPAAPDHQETP